MNTVESELASWHPYVIRQAIRIVWDHAASEPKDGLREADVAALLTGASAEERRELLALAERRGFLLKARRMEAGRPEMDHWRYFARGGRP